MKKSERRVGVIHFVVAIVLLFPILSQAQDGQVRLPFRFTEDQRLPQTDLDNAIPKANNIQTDSYLNAPMTRLEYMLTRLETHLNEEFLMDLMKKELSEFFEPLPLHRKPMMRGFARYQEETGRILVGYEVDDIGTPKKSMRTACDRMLDYLALEAPQGILWYAWHDKVLGVLEHDRIDKYNPVMETLAKNVVHRVILKSRNADYGPTRPVLYHHVLYCQKTGESAPTQYERGSFPTVIPPVKTVSLPCVSEMEHSSRGLNPRELVYIFPGCAFSRR
jgi:hypothetical protein